MARLSRFNDPTVPSNPIYWVKAFGVSSSFQDNAPGPGVTITYGFKEAGTSPFGEPARTLTLAEKNNIRDAVAKIDPYADVTFVETSAATADLLFAAGPRNDAASGTTFSGSPVEVWAYDNYNGDPNGLANNTYIYKHELLHALGLDHSTVGFGSTSPVVIPDSQDDGTTLYGNWPPGFVNDYELFDIAALQYLYGPASDQRPGNDTYTLNPGTFNPLGPQSGWPLLWDGGGFDTLDYSAFSTPVNISLEPGEISRINGASGGILDPGIFSINYRTIIEAVKGGSGNDQLSGNGADNVLSGGAGADSLSGRAGSDNITGGPGDDMIDGGDGFDTAVYSGVRASYQLTRDLNGSIRIADLRSGAPDGTDTVSNVENFRFADGDYFAGSVSIDDVTITEGDSGTKVMTFTVTRTGGAAAFAVNFATSDGTATVANGDYLSNSGTLVFGDAVNSQTVSVAINGDRRFESNETLFINLSGATNGATISDGQGIGTILNDDLPTLAPARLIDLDGDKKSDVVWRDDGGLDYGWLMNGLSLKAEGGLRAVDTSWHMRGGGDFDGDGKGDILWRQDGGQVYLWNMNGTAIKNEGAVRLVDTPWHIDGTGDFSGDGREDVIWRHDNGQVYVWNMNGASVISEGSIRSVDNAWHINATGDFDGDGKFDVLWRHDSGLNYLWTMNGTSLKGEGALRAVDTSWHIQGAGDFDGDGKDDLLWRQDGGQVYVWLMNGQGIKAEGGLRAVDNTWHIQATGDVDGDGKDDILWQHDSGLTYIWEMNGVGVKAEGAQRAASSNWHILGHDFDLI
jgi:hypothetical protein